MRPPWSWYLKNGRTEALRLTPRGFTDSIDGYSCECYYGLLGFYLAAKYFPEQEIDEKGDLILEKVLVRLFKEKASSNEHDRKTRWPPGIDGTVGHRGKRRRAHLREQIG